MGRAPAIRAAEPVHEGMAFPVEKSRCPAFFIVVEYQDPLQRDMPRMEQMIDVPEELLVLGAMPRYPRPVVPSGRTDIVIKTLFKI